MYVMYRVCSTYPKLLIVPQAVSDEELVQGAKFRMMGRIPVVVWRYVDGILSEGYWACSVEI